MAKGTLNYSKMEKNNIVESFLCVKPVFLCIGKPIRLIPNGQKQNGTECTHSSTCNDTNHR